ncbi:MAG: ABC transporter ATP-binding protein [Nitrospirota bacterium]
MKLTVDIDLAGEINVADEKGIPLSVRFSIVSEKPRVVILFGPSGSGKSSLLHCLAGMIRPKNGSIWLEECCWFDSQKNFFLSPRGRLVSLLFQNYSLFPHLTVFQNIAYGLSSKLLVQEEVKFWLKLFSLEGKEDDYPHRLSGGEKQRAALAQALAPKSRLVFLDEPFSALDRPLQKMLLFEVSEWLRQEGISAIIVLHHLRDAIAMGDELIVMGKGRILQQGTPDAVVRHPVSNEVEEILGIK